MKKLLSVSALFFLTTSGFAQVILEPKIEVEAEVTVGSDLDGPTPTGGFESNARATVSVSIRKEAHEEFGKGRLYGWIKLKDLKVELKAHSGEGKSEEEGDAEKAVFSWGDIEARVNFGSMIYLDIRKSHREVTKASRSDVITKGMFDEVEGSAFLSSLDALITRGAIGVSDMSAFEKDLGISANPEGVGVALGMNIMDDALNIEAGVSSDKVFDDSAYHNEMVVSLRADFEVIPDLLRWSLSSVNVFNRSNTLAWGEGNHYSVGMKVEPSIGMGNFVLAIPVGADFVFGEERGNLLVNSETGGGIQYTWASQGTDADDRAIAFFGKDVEVTSGVSLSVNYISKLFIPSGGNNLYNSKLLSKTTALTAQLSFYEDSGDDGIIPVMGAAFITTFHYYLKGKWLNALNGADLNGRMDLGVGFHSDYDLGVLKPFFGGFFQRADITNILEIPRIKHQTLGVTAGIEIKELVDNTTFTLAYTSGDLLNKNVAPHVRGDNLYRAQAVSDSKLGQVTLNVKVQF